jgi:heat-inducible transcriptional repressor
MSMLTQRQELVLRLVVEGYVDTGDPVGSQWIAAQEGVDFSASTVRNEFAALETGGMLGQPHTSAGRVPTERGVRHFVDRLLDGAESLAAGAPVFEIEPVHREMEEVMRAATESLAEVTELLALVSAPPLGTEEILRIELIALATSKLMVVLITSAGNVVRRVFEFVRPLDAGLVEWGTGFLNESLGGLPLGARQIRSRLDDQSLGPLEREFVGSIASVFFELPAGSDTLFVGGAGHLVTAERYRSMPGLDRLMNALEQRVAVLQMVHSLLDERGVYLRIGHENEVPELVGASVVGANYGTPTRNLGAVSVIGPVRMDYPRAIASVRQAAARLSDFVADVYA